MRLVLAATVATLAGCNAAQTPIAPVALVREPSILVSRGAPARSHRDWSRSWISPAASSSELLYVSDAGTNDVYVYTLPNRKLTGKLTGFDQPQGECSDTAGNVFITNTEKSEIVEYAHAASKPTQTLKDHGFYPVGCSVDPTTGNLAVTNIFATNGNYGSVAVYKVASGTPTQYKDSDVYYYYFCGYDDRGNLYFDGYTPNAAFAFAMLPSGTSTFLNIALNQTIDVPGMVQWDGKWVAVGDQGTSSSIIYQFKIAGSGGTLEDQTLLKDANDVVQAWIHGTTLYAPDAAEPRVDLYKYRAGGYPIKVLGGFSEPIGTTVSR
jgi:DNA-binding beta-propeller fold protein YncE